MKYILIAFISTLIVSCGYSQNAKFVRYINSFKEEKAINILNFAKIVQIDRRMSNEEALDFVYNGDTTKLYCKQKTIDIETEKVEGITSELYLPSKCLRIDMGSFFLVAHSSYQCQNPNELLRVLLTISIVDKSYKLRDNLLVYKGTDFEPEISGLLNPKNGKLFIVGDLMNNKSNQANLYKVNLESLKFESIKECKEVVITTDDLTKMLKMLEFETIFMN